MRTATTRGAVAIVALLAVDAAQAQRAAAPGSTNRGASIPARDTPGADLDNYTKEDLRRGLTRSNGPNNATGVTAGGNSGAGGGVSPAQQQ